MAIAPKPTRSPTLAAKFRIVFFDQSFLQTTLQGTEQCCGVWRRQRSCNPSQPTAMLSGSGVALEKVFASLMPCAANHRSMQTPQHTDNNTSTSSMSHISCPAIMPYIVTELTCLWRHEYGDQTCLSLHKAAAESGRDCSV